MTQAYVEPKPGEKLKRGENRRTIRVNDDVWQDAMRSCELRGTTVSAALNAYLKRLGKDARIERGLTR